MTQSVKKGKKPQQKHTDTPHEVQWTRLCEDDFREFSILADSFNMSLGELMRAILVSYQFDPHPLQDERGRERVVSKISDETLKTIDDEAKKAGIQRGQAIRQIIQHFIRTFV